MTKILNKMLTGLLMAGFVSLSPACLAADKGNADDAAGLVKKAVAYLKKNGREKSLAEFSDPKGAFIDRDLYIFVIDQNAKMLAHGALPKIIGKDVLEMKDADGNFLFKTMLALTNAKGSGWVHYKWPNPITKAIDEKSTFIEKVGDLVVGCGIYK